MSNRITPDEVNELYKEWHTPAHVIAHCRAVAHMAVKMAQALNKCGYDLDVDLVRGTGLVHDVARTCDEHEKVGCEILKNLGYDDEARIVGVHMHYLTFNSAENVDECDLICLADKLVMEDKYAGLDQRFEYIVQKAHAKGQFKSFIYGNRDKLKVLVKNLEEIIGQPLEELFKEEE